MTEQEWRYEFAFRLRKRMRQNGLTQKQLSELADVEEDTIGRYINRTTLPDSQVLSKIAKILDCETDDLIMFDDMTESGKYYHFKDFSRIKQ